MTAIEALYSTLDKWIQGDYDGCPLCRYAFFYCPDCPCSIITGKTCLEHAEFRNGNNEIVISGILGLIAEWERRYVHKRLQDKVL